MRMRTRHIRLHLFLFLVMMFPLSDSFLGQSLKDSILFITGETIDPSLDGGEHFHVQLGGTIQKSGMTETLDDTIDCALGIHVMVGPGGDDFSYCVANDDLCDLAGGVVQVAAIQSISIKIEEMGNRETGDLNRAGNKWSIAETEKIGGIGMNT